MPRPPRLIWIACWDCGKQVQVPEMESYSTHQICQDCKDERAVTWRKALEFQRTGKWPDA